MNKKATEAWILARARMAGMPIPKAETAGEKPDFRFGPEANSLGIELSELLRPASSNNGILPVAEESYHREIMALAEKEYGGKPVYVSVYFSDSRGRKRDKRTMAQALARFVEAKAVEANPFVSFYDVVDGFSSVTIASDQQGEWWSGECGGYTITDIHEQLATRIAEKNKLLPTYRENLPEGAPVWLLLYSLPSVARGMEFPHGIEKWQFEFDFERVFWFVSLLNDFVEIQRPLSHGR